MSVQEPSIEQPCIVVVDDDDFLEALSGALGFTVVVARGAAGALRVLEAQPFSLVPRG